MPSLFDRLGLLTARPTQRRSLRQYRSQCGRPVFFRNSHCLSCDTPLGYEPLRGQVLPLQAARVGPGQVPRARQEAQPLWQEYGRNDGPWFKRCANFDSAAGCNWLADPDDPDAFCAACQLNHTVPDFDSSDNARLWARVEIAKRRLVSQLIDLRLPVTSKARDPQRGLWFDFLRSRPGDKPVMTGHLNGLVTINVDEADDAYRERTRAALHEPYRTLLGHFRHEVGHYYWDRLVQGSAWLDGFRSLFGDERADYAAALRWHHEQGPPRDWADHHISSYAASHPWEDWAETWAHYLHMVDSVDTAASFGIDPRDVEVSVNPFGADALWQADDPGAPSFLRFVNSWLALTTALNELSRSMGQADFYPFVMPRPVVAKLHFIHRLIGSGALNA